jgi:hypothetical protein
MGVNCFMLHLDLCHSDLTDPGQYSVYSALKTWLRNKTYVNFAEVLGCDHYVRNPNKEFLSKVKAKYLAQIDMDEFLVLDEPSLGPWNGTGDYVGIAVPPNLNAFLDNVLSNGPVVYLHRWNFGTNGYIQLPSVLEKPEFFFLRERWGNATHASPQSNNGKYIINLELYKLDDSEDGIAHVHVPDSPNILLPDGRQMCPNYNLSTSELSNREDPSELQKTLCKPEYEIKQPLFINHYVTGSFEQCIDKYRHAFSIRGRSEEECRDYHPGTEEYRKMKAENGMINDPVMVQYATATRMKRAELFHTPE